MQQLLPEYFYEINLLTITFRLLLAVIFGGIIGLQRGAAGHPAGFRTHILVCTGATLAMLTNQYIFETMTDIADPSRMGAQVITGVGFLGVGTILVTGGGQKIRGLTTAAGLWASACIGLALGIGFYFGAVIATVIIFCALTFLKRFEQYIYNLSPVIDLYVELESLPALKEYQKFIREQGIIIMSSHLNRTGPVGSGGIGFHITVRIPKRMKRSEAVELLNNHEAIHLIEEI